jgi:hypothetical protein
MALTADDISTINQLIADFIGENKTKVSALPDATTLTGLSILGISEGISVKASMALLKGLDGKNPEFRKTTTEIQWRLEGGSTWTKLVDLSDIRGFKTALQKTSTEIQWKYENDATWTTLLALSELKGDKGDAGDKGDKGDAGPPNTLSIGTVTGGTNASASITGVAPNQTLNLVLPKGEKGETGEKGDKGLKGDTGEKGDKGDAGKSAYQVWLDAGNTGSVSVYLASLKGEKGDTGEKGDKGEKGDTGIGVPIGGATGQQLVKKSNVDYDFEWQTPAGAGDMLKSEYDTDGDGIVDNAEKVNGFTVGTDVPANAKFTDTTYSEITEAEINTGTASTLRTITARRVTFILSKVSTLISNAISALTKNDVGLGNVDNTSDVNKPVSTAQQTAINSGVAEAKAYADGKYALAIPLTQKGAASGVAELDASGKVLSSQLPSYVDDVLNYTTQSSFPATGESGKIYVTEDTNKTYRWTGSAYVEISPSIALGETSATAYRGDRGKTAYEHSQAAHAPSNAQKNSDITKAEIEAKLTGAITSHTHSAYVPTSRTVAGKALTNNITLAKGDVGLGNVDNTSDANKPVSTAQAAAIALKIDASKFQVVTELPASPVTGVFYFVKE